jgi:tripartite-type tricarboxylate transporter receptor subunit TctC
MRAPTRFAAALIIAAAFATAASAQTYPSPGKPVEIVVPFVAGGTTDNMARLLAQRFTEAWSATVIVNNRAGGGSIIGTAAVAKAPPDGHTLLITTVAFAINAGMQKLPYDPIKDFVPISELSTTPLMLTVHPSVPATNLKEFIALTKANPGKWDYASAGAGTSTHLAAEMFKWMAGVDLVHVPFKGNAEAMNAFLGGHVKVYFAQVASVLQHVKAGTLRPIAVTTAKRLPYLPDVPTIAEQGFPEYEISSWQGMWAPGGTPKYIIDKIYGETDRILKSPDVRERIERDGSDPVGTTPSEFAERVKVDIDKWAKVTKAAGLQTAN